MTSSYHFYFIFVPKRTSNWRKVRFGEVAVLKQISTLVTSQDFIKFWGELFFAFVLLVLIEFSQRFKTYESFNGKLF
jgi:hypothetical protein